jgi:hypothetical protein
VGGPFLRLGGVENPVDLCRSGLPAELADWIHRVMGQGAHRFRITLKYLISNYE